jgi:hypothetical protein
MATLADLLRGGYTPPTTSALADPIKEHFRTLPQQLDTNQRAMDKTMAGMYQTDIMGKPNPSYYPEAMQEFTQNYMPAIMGSTTAVRMAKAMENAMLPIEKGGLGLPAGNTAAQRAKAMGYDTPVYHGTNADIEAFNVKGKGKTAGAGAFLTTNPVTAETYVSASGGGNILPLLLKKDDFLTANARGRNWADIYTNQLAAKSDKTRYTPQELGLDINSATTTDELGMIANELSKKGAEIKNVKDLGPNTHVMRAKEYLLEKYGIVPDPTWSNVTGSQHQEAQKAMSKLYDAQKSDIYAVQDPSLIRSRFAAFDPKKANSPDLLAGALAVPMVDEDNRKATLERLFKEQK